MNHCGGNDGDEPGEAREVGGIGLVDLGIVPVVVARVVWGVAFRQVGLSSL